jgi:toxoflavin synthase
MMNDYDKLAGTYSRSNTKPDKLYSILPTVLDICLKLQPHPHTVFDLGCGDGFFTFPLAQQYPNATIVGIDNSKKQIELARSKLSDTQNIKFILGDIFKNNNWTATQLIVAPFVLGYGDPLSVTFLLDRIYRSLDENGLLVIVLDDPRGFDNTKFGTKKTVVDNKLQIELFESNQKPITTLSAIYHKKEDIAKFLEISGFKDIRLHPPLISEEGIIAFGNEYWNGYKENAELYYISCIK